MSSDDRAQDDISLWVTSNLQDVEPVQNLTVPELCKKNSERWGHLVAFECAVTGRRYTHREVYSLSDKFAASLIRMGYKPEDIIAIVLPNCIEYAVVLYGIWKAGCIASPMNPAYTAAELQRLVAIVGVKTVVTDSERLQTILNVKQSCPNLELLINVGNEMVNECLMYTEMTKTDADMAKLAQISLSPHDTCLLPFSSGTTGLPKGVMLTHSSVVTNLLQANSGLGDRLQSPDNEHDQERLVAILPFFHVSGMEFVLNTTMLRGCHTVVLGKFNPKTFATTVRRHNPTFLHVVPPLLSILLNSNQVLPEDLKELRTVCTGAAPAGRTLITQFKERFGHQVVFMEAYGMTEMSATHILNPHLFELDKSGSCGQPVPSTCTKIVDVKSGKTLGRYERGELCVKGPQVMKGYYNNEAATKATIDREGWLHTGDLAYYDGDGCLFIVDRLKEIIKVKGFQVAPSELENLLRSHPKVEDVAVIGIPHEEWGEVPRGYIVASDAAVANGSEMTVDEIHDFLKNQVASYKQLRGGIEVVQTIPKNPAGKILRKELLQMYKHAIQ